jgi:hypothetical protein
LAGGLRTSFLRPIHEKTPKTLTPDRRGFIAARHDQRCDLFARPSPPPHFSGLGGCSRLDHRLCRRIRSAAFSPVSASDPGGFLR